MHFARPVGQRKAIKVGRLAFHNGFDGLAGQFLSLIKPTKNAT